MGDITRKTLSGVKWTAIESISVQLLSFVVGVMLARKLTPEDYGLIGMIGIFSAIASCFIDGGLGNALIRKQDADRTDYSTVFIYNLCVSVAVYLILFLGAPLIAMFFHAPELNEIVRVISLTLIIGAFGSVQNNILNKELNFKTLAKVSALTIIVSGAVGVAMAYLGFGVWSLVYMSLANALTKSVSLWLYSHWKPMILFSKKSFKELFGYGNKLLLSSLLHTLYLQLTTLLIGRFYSPQVLGYYTRGVQMPQLASNTIMGILRKVTFPILCKLQDDDNILISVYRKYIKSTSLLIFWFMLLLMALSEPIIKFLLTDTWLPAVPYMQIFCLVYGVDHISSLNLNILQVKGRSDLFLKLEIIKKSISIGLILIAVHFSVMAVCVASLLYSQLAIIINTYYTGKLFKLGYFTQIKDFGKYFIFSAISVIPAYLLTYTHISSLLIIISGGISSLLIYIAILIISHDEIFKEYAIDGLWAKITSIKSSKVHL